MPLPSGRLDLHLVPPDPDAEPRREAAALLEGLEQRGVIVGEGLPGPRAEWWVRGGFGRIRLDDPGRVVLYANQQGGFRVSCPSCGANLVPPFSAALSAMRAGGPRSCRCPRCGREHALEDLRFQPPAAFGRLSVVTVDVASASLTPEAAAWADQVLGRWRTVLRRP